MSSELQIASLGPSGVKSRLSERRHQRNRASRSKRGGKGTELKLILEN